MCFQAPLLTSLKQLDTQVFRSNVSFVQKMGGCLRLGLLFLVVSLTLSGCSQTPWGAVGSEENHLKVAQQLIQQGDFETAYYHLNQAVAQNPNNPEVISTRGWLYLYTNEPAKATEMLDKLRTVAPKAFDTLYLTGAVYAYLEMYPDAIAAYKEALALDGQNTQLIFDLARAYSASQQYREANDMLVRGYALLAANDVNSHANYLFSLCSVQYKLKQYKKAMDYCQQAVEHTSSREEKDRITDFIETMKLAEELNLSGSPVTAPSTVPADESVLQAEDEVTAAD